MELTDTHIERWRLLLEEANADSEWLAYHNERDTKRLVAQRELLELLEGVMNLLGSGLLMRKTRDRQVIELTQ
jgi:hypothetical protein